MLYYFLIFTVVGFFIQSFNKDDKKQTLAIIIVIAVIWGLRSAPIWGFASFLEMLFGSFLYSLFDSNSSEKRRQSYQSINKEEVKTNFQSERTEFEKEQKLIEEERKLIQKERAELEKLREEKAKQDKEELEKLIAEKLKKEEAEKRKLEEARVNEEKLKKKLETEKWEKWYQDYKEEIKIINKSRALDKQIDVMAKNLLKEAYKKNVDARKFAKNTSLFS